jgi:prepilin-type N-terminal cleavage/methylation domain-containing protein
MQKYLNNNKGFTLVEVIVVAVIVLVLAAVAIPLYNGYINDSRRASMENAAGAIASGFGASIQAGGTAVINNNVTAGGSVQFNPATPTGQSSIIVIPKGFTVSTADNYVYVSGTVGKQEESVSVRYTLE